MSTPDIIIEETARLIAVNLLNHQVLCPLKNTNKDVREAHDNVIGTLMCLIHYVKISDLRKEVGRILHENRPDLMREYDAFTEASDEEYKRFRESERESGIAAKELLAKFKSM